MAHKPHQSFRGKLRQESEASKSSRSKGHYGIGLPDEILEEVFDPLTAKQRQYSKKPEDLKTEFGLPLARDGLKRQPLLVDKFLQGQFSSEENRLLDIPRLKRLAQSANRFVLTEEGTRRYAEIMRDIPDMIATHQQFALQPYDTMWMECDARILFEVTSKKQTDKSGDERVGYLFHNNTVYAFADSNEYEETVYNLRPNVCGVMPIKYDLHRPWKLEEQLRFAEQAAISRLGLVGWIWGSAMNYWLTNDESGPETLSYGPEDERRLTLAKTLRNSHTASWLNDAWILKMPIETRRALLDGSAGDLRNIVTILLLMNQPSVISYVQEVGFGKGFSKGKLRNYVSHSVVTINVDPKPIIHRLSSGTGSPHRHHLVRGHFCQNADARNGSRRGCEHQWEQDDDKHWHCVTCEGKRWWRKDHSRGDSFVGVVDKQYAIVE